MPNFELKYHVKRPFLLLILVAVYSGCTSNSSSKSQGELTLEESSEAEVNKARCCLCCLMPLFCLEVCHLLQNCVIFIYKGVYPKTQNLFIKNCVRILTCLN